jgi:hypothetical protein
MNRGKTAHIACLLGLAHTHHPPQMPCKPPNLLYAELSLAFGNLAEHLTNDSLTL